MPLSPELKKSLMALAVSQITASVVLLICGYSLVAAAPMPAPFKVVLNLVMTAMGIFAMRMNQRAFKALKAGTFLEDGF